MVAANAVAADSRDLQEAIRDAAASRTPLSIRGGDSKSFYAREVDLEILDVGGHRGIVAYEPSELVITARAGTPLRAVEDTLADAGQMLAFEPPAFGDQATIGGTIACGLSGPRRPFSGSARDFVLGLNLVNGTGEWLSFGGQVMKNVAGYDISRLNTGALGTLGVITEVSLKVLPRPRRELTLVRDETPDDAIRLMNELASRPLPLSATCHRDDRLYLRLSGPDGVVEQAAARIGGDILPGAEDFWRELKEQQLDFFRAEQPLWRLALPPATPALQLPGRQLLEWNGAQRWFQGDAGAGDIRATAAAAKGHATLFRGGDRTGEVFHPLSPALAKLHENLKRAFDPHRILNPGRMYA